MNYVPGSKVSIEIGDGSLCVMMSPLWHLRVAVETVNVYVPLIHS